MKKKNFFLSAFALICMAMVSPQTLSAEGVAFRLDSITVKDKNGNLNKKTVFGYDDNNQNIYSSSLSYSEWTTPPFAPTPSDSIAYEYNEKGLLAKESTFYYNAGTYTLNNFIVYEYNDKGLLCKETTYRYNANIEEYIDMTILEYFYKEDGSLETTLEYQRMQGAPWDTTIYDMELARKTTYSNFIDIEKPTRTETYSHVAASETSEESWRLYSYTEILYNAEMQKDTLKNYDPNNSMTGFTACIYNDNGQLEREDMATQDYSTKELSITSKNHYEYDANGNYSKTWSEIYYAYSNSWEVTNNQTYHYTRIGSGISRIVAGDVKVFYVAASQTIEVCATGTIGRVGVYAVDGRKVADAIVNGERAEIDSSAMSNGVYIVSVIVEGAIMNQKIYIYE